MCGRFVSATPPGQLARFFGAAWSPNEGLAETDPYRGNFNVAPTQAVFAVYEAGGVRRLDTFHWGLVPFWAKDPKIGSRMINARAETLAEKNSFKRPFARRRCIIPADGFYEWKKPTDRYPSDKFSGRKKKQPVYLSRVDGEPFAFAGLWDIWRDSSRTAAGGEPAELFSCTIVTGEPNETVAQVHDRMPVMLRPDAWDSWLDRDNHDTDQLRGLLVPAPVELIQLHPVSTEVNNVANNGAQLIAKARLSS